AVELRLGEKSSSLAQDLVGPTEFTILSLELLDPLSLCRRRTRPLAQIPLGLPHPATERLARAADLCSNRLDGRPLRRILTLVLEHQPNRPLPHLGGVLLCLSHDPNLSRVGVSSKPGAIQSLCCGCSEAQRARYGPCRPREGTPAERPAGSDHPKVLI